MYAHLYDKSMYKHEVSWLHMHIDIFVHEYFNIIYYWLSDMIMKTFLEYLFIC